MSVIRVRKGRRAFGRVLRLAAIASGLSLGTLISGGGAGLPATSYAKGKADKAGQAGQGSQGTKSGKSGKSGKPLSKEALFAKAAPSTVLLYVPLKGGYSLGSGVIVEPSGLVVTNAHVVASAQEQVQVFLYKPEERTLEMSLEAYVRSHKPLMGTIIKRGKGVDLALVRLPAAAYPAIELGDSDTVQVGQDVVAIGNPQGLTWTFTSGAVSALRTDAIQTDASINPGNSGGALLDMRARLIGINTFIRKDSQGLGFAIPVNAVKVMVDTFGNNTEPEPPPPPQGLALSKNPVGLGSLAISQDLGKLRLINARRSNKQVEGMLGRDLDAVEDLRVRLVKGELTVGQLVPLLVDQIKLIAQHNAAAPSEQSDPARAELQRQLEKTFDHIKQLVQLSQ
ncbi:MAG: trypsin-like peptidase domain-containing protein [Polyangia bacterium]